MEAYRKDETTIKFRKKERSTEAEGLALEVANKFESLSAACDNRGLSAFPVELVRDIVRLCNELKEKVKDCGIHADYIDYINRHKDVVGYFENSAKDVESAEESLINKRKIFRAFKNKLSEELPELTRD
jgi:hypothetical protein